MEPNLSACPLENQVAVSIQFQRASAFQTQTNGFGVGPRPNHKVVLQLVVPVAVVDQVDAGIDVVISHPGVGGHPGPPILGIIPDKVIDDTRQALYSRDLGSWTRTHELHLHRSR